MKHIPPPAGEPVDSPLPDLDIVRCRLKKRTTRRRKPAVAPMLPPPVGDEREFDFLFGTTTDEMMAEAISDGSPLAALMRLREEAAAEIERLVTFLDVTEGDPDYEANVCIAILTKTGEMLDDFDGDEPEHTEEGHDREETNEDGGDINDEPHDQDTDAEPSLGWTAEGEHGTQSLVVDAELAAELTDAERQAARDRNKAGGTGIANTKIDLQWYGLGVRLPSGEVVR